MPRENGAFNGGCKASPLTREYLREQTVNAVYENRESLLERVQISRDSADSDMYSITEASGLRVRLLRVTTSFCSGLSFTTRS